MIERDPEQPLRPDQIEHVPDHIRGRCGFVLTLDPRTHCGEPARYRVTRSTSPLNGYVCAAHAQCIRRHADLIRMESV